MLRTIFKCSYINKCETDFYVKLDFFVCCVSDRTIILAYIHFLLQCIEKQLQDKLLILWLELKQI